MTDTDTLLNAIEDPAAAKILAEIWSQIEGEPLMAARMLRSFSAVKAVLADMVKDIPGIWQQLDAEVSKVELHRMTFLDDLRAFKTLTSSEMASAFSGLKEIEAYFKAINEDAFIAKANRLLDICDRLAKAKRDGTLDLLQKIL